MLVLGYANLARVYAIAGEVCTNVGRQCTVRAGDGTLLARRCAIVDRAPTLDRDPDPDRDDHDPDPDPATTTATPTDSMKWLAP